MKFDLETVTQDLFDEMLPLLRMHYAEVQPDKSLVLDPDLQAYLNMEAAGALRIFTLRDLDGLAGYAVFIVMGSLHYQASKTAACDVVFVRADRRGVGFSFLTWVHEKLAAEGIHHAYLHMKADHDHRALMTRLGYKLEEFNYRKDFGGDGG